MRNTWLQNQSGYIPLFFIYLLMVFIFTDTTAQQPDSTINVITDAGAVGDGIADDSDELNAAVTMAVAQNKSLYFPTGTYLISKHIQIEDKVSLYGDSTGLSVIMAVNGAPDIGDQEAGKNIDNITIQDLHFLNVKVSMIGDGGYNKENYTVRRCILMATDPAFGDTEQLQWQYITLGVVEHCIFLRQSECQAGPGLRTYKTKDCMIQGNIWGLDLNQTGWLATEWKAFASWDNLLEKLETLRNEFNLDWDQGQFRCAFYPNRVLNEKIYDNIFNGSPYDNANELQDHVIYSKDYQDLEIVGNWMRGWPVTPGGGLKIRNAYGPVTVAANRFVNTPVFQYAYASTAVPEVYQNALLYRNWFDINEELTFERLGLSYWENEANGEDINIEYCANIYNCDSGIGDVHLGSGSNLAEHKVYQDNFYAGTTILIPIYPDGAEYSTGAPDSARIAPFKNYPIPSYTIPEYENPTPITEHQNIHAIESFTISPVYFNVFHPGITIVFTVPKTMLVKIDVFTTLGKRVITLVDGFKNAGKHSVEFTTTKLSTGIYYCRIITGDVMQIKKIVVF